MDSTSDILERDLAVALDTDRDILRRVRKQRLSEDEWRDVPGIGIVLSPEGEKKIRAALAAPVEAPAVSEEARDLTIAALVPNPLIVLADMEGVRVRVKLCRGGSSYYRPGMVLAGCTRHEDQPGLWLYAGPKPRWFGRF